MFEVDHLKSAPTRSFWRPERKAWAILWTAFALFCLLAWVGGLGVYHAALAPETWTLTARIVRPDVVKIQPAGMIRTELLEDGQALRVGDHVSVSSMVSTGIVARLVVSNGSVALWPQTDLEVEENEQGALRLRLEQGQAVITLPDKGASIFFSAPPLAQQIEFTGPGRYRIRHLGEHGLTTARAEQRRVPAVEVATEAGVARMGEIAIGPQQGRLISGGSITSISNRWELVRDGDWSEFDAAAYLATLQAQPGVQPATTWTVTQQAQAEGAEGKPGLFYRLRECGPPRLKEGECRNYVRLARLGGNTKDSITGVAQEIAADVASYERVILEADVRVDYQSLSKGGALGTECPLFARVDYASAQDSNLGRYFCFWAFDDGTGDISTLQYIHSQRIEPRTWQRFEVDLRALAPELRVVHQLVFYSNGHDYDASVADVSLRGEGLIDALQP